MNISTAATADVKKRFAGFYTDRKSLHLYPTEFVIRAFLGTYPKLKLDQTGYVDATVLDLGYGDGRNMPLLKNLGFRIHGIEVDEQINELTSERLKALGIKAELKLGSNRNIPYPDAYFRYVLACHSCYYVEEGSSFDDNIAEIARVMSPGGVLIGSLPPPDTYLLRDAEDCGSGHWRVKNDPFGLRTGNLMRAFKSEADIMSGLSQHFDNITVGHNDDDYWGLRQKMWVIVCRRR